MTIQVAARLKEIAAGSSADKEKGKAELNKLVEPILKKKLKPDDEVEVSKEEAQAVVKAMKAAGYEIESHSATRKGKLYGKTFTILSKASSSVTLTVRLLNDNPSHVFIIVTNF